MNKDGFLSIGPETLEYRFIDGSKINAPTIVMLHEGLGSISTWRDFPDALARSTGYKVFVYSRSGYGRSSPARLPRPMDFLRREALEVLPHVLNKIDFRNGVLLGHSDGGSIVTTYTGNTADKRLQGIVLIEPHFFVEDMNIAAIRETKKNLRTEFYDRGLFAIMTMQMPLLRVGVTPGLILDSRLTTSPTI